jgi:hypothetical protein
MMGPYPIWVGCGTCIPPIVQCLRTLCAYFTKIGQGTITLARAEVATFFRRRLQFLDQLSNHLLVRLAAG